MDFAIPSRQGQYLTGVCGLDQGSFSRIHNLLNEADRGKQPISGNFADMSDWIAERSFGASLMVERPCGDNVERAAVNFDVSMCRPTSVTRL